LLLTRDDGRVMKPSHTALENNLHSFTISYN